MLSPAPRDYCARFERVMFTYRAVNAAPPDGCSSCSRVFEYIRHRHKKAASGIARVMEVAKGEGDLGREKESVTEEGG